MGWLGPHQQQEQVCISFLILYCCYYIRGQPLRHAIGNLIELMWFFFFFFSHLISCRTLFYGVYKCRGPGAATVRGVSWARELDYETARPFLVKSFVNGRHWLGPSDAWSWIEPITTLLSIQNSSFHLFDSYSYSNACDKQIVEIWPLAVAQLPNPGFVSRVHEFQSPT